MSTPASRGASSLRAPAWGTFAASGATRDARLIDDSPGSEAPLIAERAAARGRFATEGGDERVDVQNAFELQPREPDRPAGTLSHGRSLDRLKRHAETDHPESGTGLSPPVFCAPALVAGHDAPLIDERATALQRKVAMRTPV